VIPQSVQGTLLVTNYKLIFIPFLDAGLQNSKTTDEVWQTLSKPFVSEYFSVPLSLILTVEARTLVKGSNNAGDSFVEVATKDGRQIKFILNDFADCGLLTNEIKKASFLEMLGCGHTTFKIAFTY
jgi:hypothetical protein